MCPTYQATGEEGMSTRGRANLIRAALEQRGSNRNPLQAEELSYALENCLGCRACTHECPSNVNLSLLKAELLQARLLEQGMTWRERFLSSVDWFGKLGCSFPRTTNFMLRNCSVRHLLAKCLGLAPERPLPELARQRFDRWFAKNTPPAMGPRGRVILWDDTFARYHEPHIAIAAVKVLTAAGFGVTLAQQRKCCGRPAFSQGNLVEAAALGRHNLALLTQDDAPIIFIEPSCFSMFAEDYRELKLPGAEAVAARSFLFQQFMENLLHEDPAALQFDQEAGHILVHTHCHAKALTDPALGTKLAARLPNRTVKQLDTGCCGMAGAFGMLASKYELSLKIAEPLLEQIRQQPYGTTVVLSGASCRHQVQHLAAVRTRHIAEVLADALV
jgi:Fe-S oxidoreductase